MKRALAALLLASLAPAAQALGTCSVTTLPVAFGNYDPTSASNNDSGQGTVSVTCALISGLSATMSYDIALSAGTGTLSQRQMGAGGARLNYNLYSNSGRSTIWGDGTSGTVKVSDSYLLGLTNVTRPYTVYGSIPKQQSATSGSYTDSITVTVTY